MFLGIDVGTGSLKAALFDEAGTLVATADESYGAPVSTESGADFDPARWWRACESVVRRAAQSHGAAVSAVGIAGQMHGVVLVDADGRPVRPAVLWPDDRAATTLEAFARFDDAHPGVLGNPIVPGMAGPILAWLAHHEPDSLRRADHLVQPKDWLRMQMCRAEPMTDPSDASATLLYDLSRDDWSHALCEALGLDPSLLPPIRPSHNVAGLLDPSVAERLQLPPNVPVVVGSGDAPAALLGAGIEVPGVALINTGTGGQVMTPIAAPAASPMLGPGLHQYRSASDRTTWYAMAAVANVGLALDWVRRIVGYDWDQMYRAAGSAPGSLSTSPVFLPFFAGEREPARKLPTGGVWSGLTLDDDRESLARSAMLGVASYLVLRAQAVMQVTGVTAAVLSGGAAQHQHWVELLATLLGTEVTVSEEPHLSVRGAARLAARAVGRDLPDQAEGRTVPTRADIDPLATLRRFEEDLQRSVATYG